MGVRAEAGRLPAGGARSAGRGSPVHAQRAGGHGGVPDDCRGGAGAREAGGDGDGAGRRGGGAAGGGGAALSAHAALPGLRAGDAALLRVRPAAGRGRGADGGDVDGAPAAAGGAAEGEAAGDGGGDTAGATSAGGWGGGVPEGGGGGV